MAERPEDLNLPASIVTRIVKDALPSQPSVKVSKEASTAIAKAASVFVLYATSCASTVAQNSHRKTITGNDVIRAMADMEFDKFVKPLESALDGFRTSQAKKKEETAKRKKDKTKAKEGDDDVVVLDDAEDDDADGEKKKRKEEEEDKENRDEEEEIDDDEVQEIP